MNKAPTYTGLGVKHIIQKPRKRKVAKDADEELDEMEKAQPLIKKKKTMEEKKLKLLKPILPGFVDHLEREKIVQKEINDPSEAGSADESEDTQTDDITNGVIVPDLEEWDPLSLPENFFLVLEGKRRTGKSTFAKWLLQFYQDRFQLVWVMTKTSANGFWQEFVGTNFTFSDYNPCAIQRLVERNDTIIREYGHNSPVCKLKASVLLILDDVISSDIHDDPTFVMMACEGRHHKLSIILMTQDPKAIGPKIRDNADMAVVFNQKTFRNKESVWHDFMNDVNKKEAFALLKKYAVGHDAIACNQTNLTPDSTRNYFKITGDKTKLENPDYLLGGTFQKRCVTLERAAREAKRKEMEVREICEIKQMKGTKKVPWNGPEDPEKFARKERTPIIP